MPLRTFEVSFQFDYYARSQQTISLPFAPFDSGSWVFSYNNRIVRIECEDVSTAIQGASIRLVTGSPRGPLSLETSKRPALLGNVFPPTSKWSEIIGPQYHENNAKRYARLEVTIDDSNKPPTPRKSDLVARCNAGHHHSQSPNDVVFYFPRCNRELWANSTAPKQASPHFNTMLDSGYKEGVVSAGNGEAAQPDHGPQEDSGFDSDGETDGLPCGLAATRTSRTLPAGVREIVITSTAYTTYHATLIWLHYGHIQLAPLSTASLALSSTGSEPPAKRARTEEPAFAESKEASLPLPASPKSVYKLAHFLELPDLMQIALNGFKSQLTTNNVLYQLVDDIAVYDEVKHAITAFAMDNWKAVKKTRASAELMKPEVLAQLPHPLEAGARLFELARRC